MSGRRVSVIMMVPVPIGLMRALAEERVHSTDEPGLHHRKAQDLEGNVLLPFASFQLVVR